MKKVCKIKYSTILIFTFLICSCATKKTDYKIQPEIIETKKNIHKSVNKDTPRPICITGVGDIMLGTNFPSPDYLPPDDGKSLLLETSPILKNSDITFGNLECSLLDSGECIKDCKDPTKCYAFRMPEHYVNNLKKAGFNLLSIANNHIGDFGIKGREQTVNILSKNNINFAGLDTHPSTTFTLNGVKYGFCAFAPNSGTPDIREIRKACKTVKALSKVSDIVIVSFHGGAEGAENRHVTRKQEFFYGENRGNVYKFAHKVINAGADIVFGHGPHVPRAIELYKDRFIAYSMGNFCTYARFNLLGTNGIAPIFKIFINKKGEFLSGRLIPVIQEFKKGPAPDKNCLATKEIIELTSTDFPKTNLSISIDGQIYKKK